MKTGTLAGLLLLGIVGCGGTMRGMVRDPRGGIAVRQVG